MGLLSNLLGLTGAIETVKQGTSQSLANLRKITARTKVDNAQDIQQALDEELKQQEEALEKLSGKLRFRQRMIDEELNENRYKKLNQKQYNYSIAILFIATAFLTYTIVMLISGMVFISLLAIMLIITVYLDTLKKATEIREQAYISLKEFLTKPKWWLPTVKRENEYFNIEDKAQVEETLEQIETVLNQENSK